MTTEGFGSGPEEVSVCNLRPRLGLVEAPYMAAAHASMPRHDCSPSEFQRIQTQIHPTPISHAALTRGHRPAAGRRRRTEEGGGQRGFHLFLGNLGVDVDEVYLTRVFSKFASFVPGSARLKRLPDGTTGCYGYVTFSERRDIDAAMAEFEGQLVGTGTTGPVRLSSCLYNAEARRLSPAQLRERCEMRKRLYQERCRRAQRG